MKTTRNITLMLSLLLAMAVAFGCATGGAQAPAENAAADWMFPDQVDAAFLAQYAKVPMPEKVMIIDSRPTITKYDKGHIPMSVNIPWSQFDKKADLLPEDKSTLLIFYCGGYT